MQLKSKNIYYILGLVPLTALDFLLAVKLTSGRWWLSALIGVLGVVTIICIIRKFLWIPHSEASYGTLVPLKLTLPVPYEVDLFTCEAMADYDFLNRVVEVISPIWPAGRLKVAVNPVILKEKGETFMRTAVCRELRRYEDGSSLKILLGLVAPIETAVLIVLGVWAYQVNLSRYFGSFFLNFILPFLMVILLGVDLYLWNRFVSGEDIKLDRYLTKYFTPEEIVCYIETTEEMQSACEGEKSRKFNEHYMEERIKKLYL